jgi:uncharacterized membrane protein
MSGEERPYVTARELAREHGVSRSTIWRWVARGLVEVSRVGVRTRVRVRLREPGPAPRPRP